VDRNCGTAVGSLPELGGMQIRGLGTLSLEALRKEIQAGGRFVFYEYCISAVVVSLRRPTDIYFLRSTQNGLLRGLPYALVSLLLGWWGIPWWLIYTPLTLITNLSGGCDVTEQVVAQFLDVSSPSGAGARPTTLDLSES
jgi:hypothetical protein